MEIGKKYSIKYPFKKCKYFDMAEDGAVEIDSWMPGCNWHEYEYETYGGNEVYADGEGEMLLEIISIHKPGKYPERIFYLRNWKDPEGNTFGKPKLRITTTQNFKSMLKGYRYEYDFNPED